MSVNENMIGRLHPTHLKKCGVLQNLARRGRGHKITYTNYQNTLGTVLPFAPPPVQSIAWNLADSSGVASNFDYAKRADIARVYAQQEIFNRLASELTADFRPLVFTRDVDFFLVARNAALDCTSVTSAEDRLEKAYRTEIGRLP
jgi:hypothetical protein